MLVLILFGERVNKEWKVENPLLDDTKLDAKNGKLNGYIWAMKTPKFSTSRLL